MPPRANRSGPKQSVAVVGIKCDLEDKALENLVKKVKNHLVSDATPPLIKDKSDMETATEKKRHLVFLNCKTAEGAKSVCAILNAKPEQDLGITKYGHVLQACTKDCLRSLSWDAFSKAETQTVEGKISKKMKKSCLISDPLGVGIWVDSDVFEGSDDVWNQLQEGDMLRVTAEKDETLSQQGAQWKATEAVLVAKQGPAHADKKTKKAAEEKVFADAEEILGKVLQQNLRGKGWISLKSIGPWFTTTAEVKEALQIVKTKHKQLKNFVAESPLVEAKSADGDFFIALVEDLQQQRATLSAAEVQTQMFESMQAKGAVQSAEVVTADETTEEQEGRARSYRIQRAILELVPQILQPVLLQAWEQKTNSAWSEGSGTALLGQIRQQKQAEGRIGKAGIDKVKSGAFNKWDITLFSLILVDDPGLLPGKSAAAKAVRDLRTLRNKFVHDLHLQPALPKQEFDDQWEKITKLLGDLTSYVGKDEARQLLERESSKILQERVDAQKERKYAQEFNHMRGELVRLEDKVGGIEENVAGLQARMVTHSIMGSVMEEKIAKAMQMLQMQQMASPSSESSTEPGGTTSVQLDGQTFQFVFGPDSVDKLGTGAQGSVYKARCGSRMIALKVPESGKRISEREYVNLAKIRHKNVVKFLGRGTMQHGGSALDVIGMDLVVGISYEEYLAEKDGHLPWFEVAQDFRQIIDGMSAVHAEGIIHRDLKPANIVRKKNGDIVIVDFGLSKDTMSSMATATMAGRLMGTPAYCSPEADNPRSHTLATDVFSMGIILYEAVSGFLPWGGDVDSQERSKVSTLAEGTDTTMFAYILNVKRKAPAALGPSEVPPSINEFVIRCLSNKPQDRFQSAGEMLAPWDNAVELARETVRVRDSEAQTFWKTAFGEDETVELARFKRVVVDQWSISDDAAQKLAQQVDADQSGSIELEEFLKHFSESSMEAVANQAREQATNDSAGEPEGVFFSKSLTLSDVQYISKGTLLAFNKKQRIGTLTLSHAEIVVRRYEGSSALVVYSFNLMRSQVSRAANASEVEIKQDADKPRKFTFKDTADCSAFAAAFAATKAWLEG